MNFHVDYSPSTNLSHEDVLDLQSKIRGEGDLPICCDRFKSAVEGGDIVFSYADSIEIDETSWFIPGLWHLYYCPFCGNSIKGHGFGDYRK